jgi:uncharacterized protein YjcR
MKSNREKLISLMTKHNLNAIQVAALLGVKPNTVRVWRSKNVKYVPDSKLELLRFKLNA